MGSKIQFKVSKKTHYVVAEEPYCWRLEDGDTAKKSSENEAWHWIEYSTVLCDDCVFQEASLAECEEGAPAQPEAPPASGAEMERAGKTFWALVQAARNVHGCQGVRRSKLWTRFGGHVGNDLVDMVQMIILSLLVFECMQL